jgi:hypothetical protein
VAKAEPIAKTEPVTRVEPVVRRQAAAKAEPVAKSEPVAKTETVAKAEAVVRSQPTRTAAAAGRAKPVGPDWRTYGPMQVDWANWRAMGGSFVAPSLGSDGKPHYLAVNCGARKLNATSQSGQWKTWDSPQNDFEQQLVSDICTSKGA